MANGTITLDTVEALELFRCEDGTSHFPAALTTKLFQELKALYELEQAVGEWVRLLDEGVSPGPNSELVIRAKQLMAR